MLFRSSEHALPALAGLLAAQAVGLARRDVFHYAGLAFLGLADPRQPTWGGMLNEAMPWLAHPAALWCALYPKPAQRQGKQNQLGQIAALPTR